MPGFARDARKTHFYRLAARDELEAWTLAYQYLKENQDRAAKRKPDETD